MKKKISLKWKIAGYLSGFAALLIGLIVLFQIVLLEPMYEHNKIESLKSASAELEEALYEENLSERVYQIALNHDVCVRVFGRNQDITIGNMGCTLYRMGDYEFVQEVNLARNNNGTSLTEREESNGSLTGKTTKSMTYTNIVENDSGMNVIMVNANITPVDATTRTLTNQLWYIGGIILVVVFLLVILMNATIAKPLVRITDNAKSLSHGKYAADPHSDSYREAAELNQVLTQAAVDIQRADQAKRDLISNVSHDLRTPLTMINGYGEMMRDLPGEKTDENLQVIIDESKRLTALVNDLLDLSRMEANRIELQRSAFSLGNLVARELRKYDVYRMQDGFEITLECEENLQVNGDEKRIEQVFNNFMTNAINYSGNSRQIIVRCCKAGENARVEVQDFGEGIEEKELSSVWDRYYKIDKKHVRAVSGSGIGLAIVREILELHKVPYGVVSKKGTGSTFWFELPLVKEENKGA